MAEIIRIDGRKYDELRQVKFEVDYLSHPAASVLISCGKTREIAAASVEDKVPQWMKNQKVPGGWITCEYGMLPSATGERFKREASAGKQVGRTVEIQRLIGRSLRAAVDLENWANAPSIWIAMLSMPMAAPAAPVSPERLWLWQWHANGSFRQRKTPSGSWSPQSAWVSLTACRCSTSVTMKITVPGWI